MPPEEVGEKVLRAIRRNDFYVFTHPEHRDELREIFDETIAAFPDEPVPAERSRGRGGAARLGRPAPRLLARRLMREVEGRTAFVTGGASGIGLGMATAFAAAGMNVVIADLRRDHIETALERLSGRSRARDRARRHRPRGLRERRRRGGAGVRQRARALQQRGRGRPRPPGARALRRLGLGPRRPARRRRSTVSRPSCRGCSRTGKAATSSTRRRWQACSRCRTPSSTRPRRRP